MDEIIDKYDLNLSVHVHKSDQPEVDYWDLHYTVVEGAPMTAEMMQAALAEKNAEIARLRKAILRARRKVSVNQAYDAIVELDKALNNGDDDGKRG